MPVISRIDLRSYGANSGSQYAQVLPRAAVDISSAVSIVTPLLNDIRDRGLGAVIEATARFDGVDLATTRVPQAALDAALAAMDPQVRLAVAVHGWCMKRNDEPMLSFV